MNKEDFGVALDFAQKLSIRLRRPVKFEHRISEIDGEKIAVVGTRVLPNGEVEIYRAD